MDLEDDLYRIGTVAALTDIAVERLRAWERRYDLAPARKVGRTRFYSADQVRWLKSIKALIDQGQPISSLVSLSQQQLDARLTVERGTRTRTEPATVALIGTELLLLEQRHRQRSRLDVRERSVNLDSYLAAFADADTPPEALVVQMPVLTVTPLQQLADIAPDTELLVLHEFATRTETLRAEALELELLRWPQPWEVIEQAVATLVGVPLRGVHGAARRFTDDELLAIAASAMDPNDCPAHLVELITRLNAFADFTAALASEAEQQQGSDSPEQARKATAVPARALYHRLHTDTTAARATLEQALELAADAEALLSRAN